MTLHEPTFKYALQINAYFLSSYLSEDKDRDNTLRQALEFIKTGL